MVRTKFVTARHHVVSKYSIARGGRTAGNKHRGISPFGVPTSLKSCAVSLCTCVLDHRLLRFARLLLNSNV